MVKCMDARGDNAFEFGHYGPDSGGLRPTAAASGSGLVHIADLLSLLLAVAPSGKIDDIPIRHALTEALKLRPNTSLQGKSMAGFLDAFSASIRCALLHARRLKQQPSKWKQVHMRIFLLALCVYTSFAVACVCAQACEVVQRGQALWQDWSAEATRYISDADSATLRGTLDACNVEWKEAIRRSPQQ